MNNKAFRLAERVESFSLDFDSTDMWTPDCLPWTLHFTLNGEEHHFAGQNLDDLFGWALGFADGRLDKIGRPVDGT